jgi:hypothetical protein
VHWKDQRACGLPRRVTAREQVEAILRDVNVPFETVYAKAFASVLDLVERRDLLIAFGRASAMRAFGNWIFAGPSCGSSARSCASSRHTEIE